MRVASHGSEFAWLHAEPAKYNKYTVCPPFFSMRDGQPGSAHMKKLEG